FEEEERLRGVGRGDDRVALARESQGQAAADVRFVVHDQDAERPGAHVRAPPATAPDGVGDSVIGRLSRKTVPAGPVRKVTLPPCWLVSFSVSPRPKA